MITFEPEYCKKVNCKDHKHCPICNYPVSMMVRESGINMEIHLLRHDLELYFTKEKEGITK